MYINTFDEPVGGLANPGGEVAYGLARSVPLGGQTVLQHFEDNFKNSHSEIVKDTTALPPEHVRKTIVTGLFKGSGREFDCVEDVQEATSLFLNQFTDTYH